MLVYFFGFHLSLHMVDDKYDIGNDKLFNIKDSISLSRAFDSKMAVQSHSPW